MIVPVAAFGEIKAGFGGSLHYLDKAYGRGAYEISLGLRPWRALALNYRFLGEANSGSVDDTEIRRTTSESFGVWELEIFPTNSLSILLFAGKSLRSAKVRVDGVEDNVEKRAAVYGGGLAYRFYQGKSSHFAITISQAQLGKASQEETVNGRLFQLNLPNSSATTLTLQYIFSVWPGERY